MRQDFLKRFIFDIDGQELYFAYAVGHPSHLKYLPAKDALNFEFPEDKDVYFAPALKKEKIAKKEGVCGTSVLWVDVDYEQFPQTTFAPSMVVWSGHGWHLYWVLEEPLLDTARIDALNKVLEADVKTADKGIWNANRVLRIPGTMNNKQEPVAVELRNAEPHVYSLTDFLVLGNLDDKTRHKIRTGDRRGYKSRSERDWAVVTSLMAAGAEESLIFKLYASRPVGDKHQDPNTAHSYLKQTIQRARESKLSKPNGAGNLGLEEREDGYYVTSKRTVRRISTFTMEPNLLLDGSAFDAEDAIVGDVTAAGHTWEDVTFPRAAFTTVRRMDKECPLAAWQWLGRDEDVRQLLPFMLDKLQGKGLPKIMATDVLGLHKIEDNWYYVGTDDTIGANNAWEGYEGPMAWLPTKREHPELYLKQTITSAQLKQLGEMIPKLHEPEVIWPMLGWYAAAMVKPWLEEQFYRYPVLNVTGTRGSGKTTLIQRVLMPLFGQKEPKSYDAGTTRFVILSLLGSSNATPIAFSEFRYMHVEKFLRYVLLAYDTGHDPRGRADQTTVDYALSAPFSIDGEDLLVDPAAQQRIVVARLSPHSVAEGSEAYETFNELRELDILEGFAGLYVQQLLQAVHTGKAKRILDKAKQRIFSAYPGRLPDRVRNNHIVTYFGIWMFCEATGLELPDAKVLDRSIRSVYNLEAERGRTMSDEFVEDIVNSAAAAQQRFKYTMVGGHFYFQLSTAHNWWLAVRRGRGRGGLEREAIMTQIKEAEYFTETKVVKGMWMYGIDLHKAQSAGLDIPNEINTREVNIKL